MFGGGLLLVSTMQPIVHIALRRMLLRDRTESNVSYSGSKIGMYLSCVVFKHEYSKRIDMKGGTYTTSKESRLESI